jgi:hypothetical protein
LESAAVLLAKVSGRDRFEAVLLAKGKAKESAWRAVGDGQEAQSAAGSSRR